MGLIQQKLRAFAIHFAISLVVIGSFLAFVYFILYTPEILHLEGGDQITLIIFGVDLTLGPLMTLILYRKGKPGLLLDLVLVGLIQFSALIYGGWVLYAERPVYIAFVKEHFEIIPLGSIEIGELKDPSLQPRLLSGPRLVYVERPGNEASQKIMWQALEGGKDLHLLPEYYRPFEPNLEPVRKRHLSLESLRREHPAAVPVLEAALKELGRTEETVTILPIMGNAAEGAAILDRAGGKVLKYVEAVIW